MIRIAQERIADLFGLARREARTGGMELATRYVRLARKVGTRYNVRLRREDRDLYCRGCSTYWVEGSTVRTRIRNGRRIQTCLTCARVRRVLLGPARDRRASPEGSIRLGSMGEPAIVEEEDEALPSSDEGEEEQG